LIEVTAAIIKRDGKLLICQRPKGKRCELLWEFPGGKIETGETAEECLIRECREELDVIVKIVKLVKKVDYQYPDINVCIYFYLCELDNKEPTCVEHNKIQWCTIDEILDLSLCPADNKMLSLAENDIKGMV
jgi:8-oxo-dGTP diphosphatase